MRAFWKPNNGIGDFDSEEDIRRSLADKLAELHNGADPLDFFDCGIIADRPTTDGYVVRETPLSDMDISDQLIMVRFMVDLQNRARGLRDRKDLLRIEEFE